MVEAVRRIIRNGDTTTAGGSVIAPGTSYTVMGKQIANVNCQVQCPACNSVGTIQSVPPMPTYFDYGGVRAAFDGDLCICGCTNHPRLLSSLTNWSASSFEAPISSTPAAADWLISAGHVPEEHGFTHNEQFLLKDAAGKPLRDTPYTAILSSGTSLYGRTNEEGLTQRIYTNSMQGIELFLGDQRSMGDME